MRWRKVLSPLGRPVRAVICTRANRRLVRGAALSPKVAALRFPQCSPFLFFFVFFSLHFTSLHLRSSCIWLPLCGTCFSWPPFLCSSSQEITFRCTLRLKETPSPRNAHQLFLGFLNCSVNVTRTGFYVSLIRWSVFQYSAEFLRDSRTLHGKRLKNGSHIFSVNLKVASIYDWFSLKVKFLPSSACLRCFDTTEELFSFPQIPH